MRSRLSFNQNKSDMNLDEHEEIEEEQIDEEAELFYNGIHSWINADENIKTILKHVNTEIMWHELKQHRSQYVSRWGSQTFELVLELMNVKGRDLRDVDDVVCDLDAEPCPSPIDEMVPGQTKVYQKEPQVKKTQEVFENVDKLKKKLTKKLTKTLKNQKRKTTVGKMTGSILGGSMVVASGRSILDETKEYSSEDENGESPRSPDDNSLSRRSMNKSPNVSALSPKRDSPTGRKSTVTKKSKKR